LPLSTIASEPRPLGVDNLRPWVPALSQTYPEPVRCPMPVLPTMLPSSAIPNISEFFGSGSFDHHR